MTKSATPEQIQKYIDRGMAMGLSTEQNYDEAVVRSSLDKHRQAHGYNAAKNYLVFDSPEAAMRAIPQLTVSNALYGSFDSYWLASWELENELGSPPVPAEEIQHYIKACEMTGWMWMSSDTTVVTHKPIAIRMIEKPTGNGDTVRVLHNYDGLALEYRDGTGVYVINGLRIPANLSWICTTPADELDAAKVMGIENTEIRTEALKKMGVERAFDLLDKKTLDTDTLDPGGYYELFQIMFGERPRTYLRGKCPSSGKPFFEAVPPNITTCQAALMWRVTRTDLYKFVPPKVRT